jgi:hypothetical protein
MNCEMDQVKQYQSIKARQIFLLLYFFSCSFIPALAIGQHGIIAAGVEIKNSFGEISATIGQLDYIYLEDAKHSMNLGIQQPYIFLLDQKEKISECHLFPNPTYGGLFISGLDPEITSLTYSVYNISGFTLIYEKELAVTDFIDISQTPPGVYIVWVTTNKGERWKCTVVKN